MANIIGGTVHNGERTIYTFNKGERWTRFRDVILVVHPERPPKVIYDDGTITELTCLPDPPKPSAK